MYAELMGEHARQDDVFLAAVARTAERLERAEREVGETRRELAELRAENERLRRLHGEASVAESDHAVALRAENERLRATAATLRTATANLFLVMKEIDHALSVLGVAPTSDDPYMRARLVVHGVERVALCVRQEGAA